MGLDVTLDEHGFVTHRVLSDGRIAAVVPLIFGGRICVGRGYESYEHGY